MIIYQITLPKKQKPEAFIKFMRDEYFPAVHKGQTRVGQVIDLTLLERKNEFQDDDKQREFFCHIGWEGLPLDKLNLDNLQITAKLDAFGAKVKPIGTFEEVAVWRNETQA